MLEQMQILWHGGTKQKDWEAVNEMHIESSWKRGPQGGVISAISSKKLFTQKKWLGEDNG